MGLGDPAHGTATKNVHKTGPGVVGVKGVGLGVVVVSEVGSKGFLGAIR